MWTCRHGRERRAKVPPCTLLHVTKKRLSHRFVLAWSALVLALVCEGCREVTPLDDLRVFRYNESANITSLDPAQARSLEHMWVVDQLYDGLVELSADLEVIPCLARSWSFNDSTLTYRFHLRDDVVFTTGKPLRSKDVVLSLERLRSEEVVSSGGWILESVQEEGIVEVDSLTVDIHLKQVYPPFLGLLTTAYASIIDAQALNDGGKALRDEPAGSGPFKLAWWIPDAGLVLHRNDTYWEHDKHGVRLPIWRRYILMSSKTWALNFWDSLKADMTLSVGFIQPTWRHFWTTRADCETNSMTN